MSTLEDKLVGSINKPTSKKSAAKKTTAKKPAAKKPAAKKSVKKSTASVVAHPQRIWPD